VELARVIAMAVATVGVAALAARLLLGDTMFGLVAAVVVGGGAYAAVAWRGRASIHLESFLTSMRGAGAPRPTVRTAQEL
jgi:hypothetical protein